MITFQIIDPVVDHFDLLFHNRHTLCEVVVFSDFSGQSIYLGFHNTLAFVVGNQNTNQGNATGNEGRDDSIIHLSHPQ